MRRFPPLCALGIGLDLFRVGGDMLRRSRFAPDARWTRRRALTWLREGLHYFDAALTDLLLAAPWLAQPLAFEDQP